MEAPAPGWATSAMVSGAVAIEGGGAFPDAAAVQAVCGGSYGDTVYTRDRFRVIAGQSRYSEAPGAIRGAQVLSSCELRVTLSGFLPATVALPNLSPGANEVGTVVLRKREGVSGFTYSMTGLTASKEARKAYDKGRELSAKGKLGEAEAALREAVRLHPAYATAWFELGTVYHRQGRGEEARGAYEKSIAADSKYMKPTLQLAMMLAAERRWPEVAELTQHIIASNPFEFPQAFLYRGVAAYNLKDPATAERAVARAIELDPQHALPKAFHLMGTILAERGDLTGAAENLHAYLKYAPKAADAETVRRQLAEVDQRAGRN
jgi:Flp pilus assembly protein TadD